MKTYSALVVDDEPDILELLEITLNRMDISCQCAQDLKRAKELLNKNNFDVCLTDMRLPDGDGIDLVAYIQQNYSQIPVAVITAHGNMETAIKALKSGAFDFVTKPIDLPTLRSLITNALSLYQDKSDGGRSLIGESEVIKETRKKIDKLARNQAPIYISGESGVGKELVARMIHEQGPRAQQPFVPVNCGAIPHDLMESEFFGHIKGSFTGASADKHGLFHAADGGTLFLDEIAELPLSMQVKLLRAIQEKTVRQIGAQVEEPVNVRILSSTHKDLQALVSDSTFREDLFYRINVIELKVPPLRERKKDIPLLAEFIIDKIFRQSGSPRPELSNDVLSRLLDYSFPGNVRELENMLERAIALSDGKTIRTEDLQIPQVNLKSIENGKTNSDEKLQLNTYLSEVERNAILQALEKTRWNKTAAAKLLGISFRALRYKLEKLDLN